MQDALDQVARAVGGQGGRLGGPPLAVRDQVADDRQPAHQGQVEHPDDAVDRLDERLAHLLDELLGRHLHQPLDDRLDGDHPPLGRPDLRGRPRGGEPLDPRPQVRQGQADQPHPLLVGEPGEDLGGPPVEVPPQGDEQVPVARLGILGVVGLEQDDAPVQDVRMAPDHAVGQPQGEDQQPADADDRPGDPHVADHPRQPQEPQQPEEPGVLGGVRQQDPVGEEAEGDRRQEVDDEVAAEVQQLPRRRRELQGELQQEDRADGQIRPGERILLGGRQRPGVLQDHLGGDQAGDQQDQDQDQILQDGDPPAAQDGLQAEGDDLLLPLVAGPPGQARDLPDGRGDPVLPRPVLVAGLPPPRLGEAVQVLAQELQEPDVLIRGQLFEEGDDLQRLALRGEGDLLPRLSPGPGGPGVERGVGLIGQLGPAVGEPAGPFAGPVIAVLRLVGRLGLDLRLQPRQEEPPAPELRRRGVGHGMADLLADPARQEHPLQPLAFGPEPPPFPIEVRRDRPVEGLAQPVQVRPGGQGRVRRGVAVEPGDQGRQPLQVAPEAVQQQRPPHRIEAGAGQQAAQIRAVRLHPPLGPLGHLLMPWGRRRDPLHPRRGRVLEPVEPALDLQAGVRRVLPLPLVETATQADPLPDGVQEGGQGSPGGTIRQVSGLLGPRCNVEGEVAHGVA